MNPFQPVDRQSASEEGLEELETINYNDNENSNN